MTGEVLAQLIVSYVEKINTGAVPHVVGVAERVIRHEQQRVLESAKKRWEESV